MSDSLSLSARALVDSCSALSFEVCRLASCDAPDFYSALGAFWSALAFAHSAVDDLGFAGDPAYVGLSDSLDSAVSRVRGASGRFFGPL